MYDILIPQRQPLHTSLAEKMICLVVLFSAVALGSELPLIPTYITPCEWNAADFGTCALDKTNTILEQFGKGEPLLNVAALEDIQIPLFASNEQGINITSSFVIHGFEKIRATQIRKTADGVGIEAQFYADKLVYVGHFDIGVDVPAIYNKPLQASGDGIKTWNNFGFKYVFKWKVVTRGDADYVEITNLDIDMQAPTIKFDIQGVPVLDETTGETVNDILNNHSNEIFESEREGVKVQMIALFEQYAKPVFAIVPKRFLFL